MSPGSGRHLVTPLRPGPKPGSEPNRAPEPLGPAPGYPPDSVAESLAALGVPSARSVAGRAIGPPYGVPVESELWEEIP